MPLVIPPDQKSRRKLVNRRHPAYSNLLGHWQFCRATYDGGRDWFKPNLFKYVKEGLEEFDARIKRAYRFNHTREVVNLVTKYIFKSDVIRNTDDAPEVIKAFWKSTTRAGEGIDEFQRRVCDLTSIYGRVWIGTDTVTPTTGLITVKDEKTGAARPYAYTVNPENVLDYSWAEDGTLNWIMFAISHRDDEDPIASTGFVSPRYVIWTRASYVILEDTWVSASRRDITIIDAGLNKIGRVPLFKIDDRESDEPYSAPGLIDEIAYLDRAVANYLSNLDAIIQDQTFSQLVIPSQSLLPGDDAYLQLIAMGTKRVFTYDGEGGAAPMYISPDPKQAGVIMGIVNKIIAEIYHSTGMAGERTKQDNAVGIDNSSGVAKAYDFERVNSLLTHKADVLERVEDGLIELICLWTETKQPLNADGSALDLVKYPDNFDVRNLYDEFQIAEQLSLVDAPEELRREQMRGLVAKMFPRLKQDLITTIEADIKQWPPKIDPVSAGLSVPTGKDATGKLTTSRQGQVTPTTTATPKGSTPKPSKNK